MPRDYSKMTPAERAFVDEETRVTTESFGDTDDEINKFIDECRDPGYLAAKVAIGLGAAMMVRKYVPALLERVATLENKLAEVETKTFQFKGVYQRAQDYRKGHGVTCNGSLWISLVDNPQGMPGNGPDWQLCVPGGGRAR